MARFYTAIATDGQAAHPQVVHGSTEKDRLFTIDSAQMSGIRAALAGVVLRGTAAASHIDGLTLAGKTGTAQNSQDKVHDHAWFVGFAPADNPKIVVAVMIEFGGQGARSAHIAASIIQHYLKATPEQCRSPKGSDEAAISYRTSRSSRSRSCCRCSESQWCTRPGRPTSSRASRRSGTARCSGLRSVSSRHTARAGPRSAMLEWLSPPLYAATSSCCCCSCSSGRASARRPARSWLQIGGFRIGQPSEIAKIVVVLMLAKVLAARRDAPKSLIDLWQPAAVVGIPWLLIMAQPDLGTGLVFIGIFFAMLFWSGCSWQLLMLAASPGISLVLAVNTTIWGAWFLLLIGLVLWYRPYIAEGVFVVVANIGMGVIAPLVWEKLNPYQQKRLLVFLDPGSDPLRSGYHVIQSQVAIGSGGWLGKGFTMGTQKRLAFLPAQHTDFIFPVVGEELGFVGVTVALTLFLGPVPALRARGRPGDRLVLQPRGVRDRGHLVRPRPGERRDDPEPDADNRHTAPLLLLRGVVHAGVLDRRRHRNADIRGG